MAPAAVARQALSALRREIARIEDRPAAWSMPDGDTPDAEAFLLRRQGRAGLPPRLASGAAGFDRATGGGLEGAGLTEFLGSASRDAGAVAGVVLGFAAIRAMEHDGPFLWLCTGDVLREAGLPYAPALAGLFGIAPQRLVFGRVERLADLLWIAEEAARLSCVAALVIEVRGSLAGLDLKATRRLDRRAREARQPVLLIRHAARPAPTAAAMRLAVEPAPSATAPLAAVGRGFVGPPAAFVAIDKSRTGPPARFLMEWSPDERRFRERQPSHPFDMVSEASRRPDPPHAAGTVMAFQRQAGSPAGAHLPGKERAPDRGPRRTG